MSSSSVFKRILLKLFRVYAARSFARLEQALKNPQQSQMRTLQAILSHAHVQNVKTQACGSGAVRTYAEFLRLPLVRYEDIERSILTAKNVGAGFLSVEKPFNYEPTSGSSGVRKLIPYTRPLLQSFTQMFLCWAYDLLHYGPKLAGGRMYFSVSPQFHEQETGLADDSDYLSGLTGLAFQFFALLPAQIKKLKNPDDFFEVLCLYLLAADDLEIISVWSPSFLLSVVNYLSLHADELIQSGALGCIERAGITFSFGSISQLKLRALEDFSEGQILPLQVLFPALKLISCWGAHNSAAGYSQLQRLFPAVLVQEKGLLATEAPITIPSLKHGAFLPLLQEVFFEFLDAHGRIHLIHELEIGQSYELILSQKGGVLRYRLKDQIRVDSKVYETPCFSFVGRAEEVSDLVGEKLNEIFVADLAMKLFSEDYLCLIPDQKTSAYILCSERMLEIETFEKALMTSPHYHNARKLKQLNAMTLRWVPELPSRLKDFFVSQRGMLRGDVKDRYLYSKETDGELLDFLLRDVSGC